MANRQKLERDKQMNIKLTAQEVALLFSALDRKAEDFENYSAQDLKDLGIFEYVAQIDTIAKKLGATRPLTNATA